MHSDNPSENTINAPFKRHEICAMFKCLVASSHVPTLKHEAKHGYITQKQLFVCFMKQLKETLLGYILYLCYLCVSVSVHERTPLNIQRFHFFSN